MAEQRNKRRGVVVGTLAIVLVAIALSDWRSASRLRVLRRATASYSFFQQRRLTLNGAVKPLRILYIVTSVAEYNNGRRFTTHGEDRMVNVLLPVLQEGVESMLSFGYHVDVYLILHWEMRPFRLEIIRKALPPSVKLDYWDDATPIGYKMEHGGSNTTQPITRGLARQHRYVIKDKFLEYDFFVNFEDDMLIKGEHVENFLSMTRELEKLQALAPDFVIDGRSANEVRNDFYGPLGKKQYRRMVPGLMRVEVLLNEAKHGAQKELDPVPVDLDFGGVNRTVDPRPCCHVSNKTANDHLPSTPNSSKLFVWETGIRGLSVRELPSPLGWVMLQSGAYAVNKKRVIGDYWSGRDGAFGNETRPGPEDLHYINNQGGWMGTREQIWEWHTVCPGGFLPPYDKPNYPVDGLDLRNVEYWSGGLSLFSFYKACNLQRIVSLEPDQFSRHLIYHSANNKQKQLTWQRKSHRFVKADNLLGQLNTVLKHAKATKDEEMRALQNSITT